MIYCSIFIQNTNKFNGPEILGIPHPAIIAYFIYPGSRKAKRKWLEDGYRSTGNLSRLDIERDVDYAHSRSQIEMDEDAYPICLTMRMTVMSALISEKDAF